jgi:hypothetical protein
MIIRLPSDVDEHKEDEGQGKPTSSMMSSYAALQIPRAQHTGKCFERFSACAN